MKLINLYSETSLRYSLGEKREVARWTLMLPGAGCEYYRNCGGCTMCGFGQSTKKYSRGLLLWNGIFKAMYLLAEKQVKGSSPKELFIYNGGSFWNDREIPLKFRDFLYQKIAKHDSVNRLFIENRCEYITGDKIDRALDIIGNKNRLSIGIGLESQDDYVRNRVIKKNLSKKLFEEKVRLIDKHGADVVAYIFLKPISLSEAEAFKEVIASINYAVSVGVKEIYLSCAFVQENTRMAEEFYVGRFKPPNLWTILEVIAEVQKNHWPVLIGGFNDEPVPIAIPENCSLCSPAIYQAIEQYRRTRILGKVPTCSCKTM